MEIDQVKQPNAHINKSGIWKQHFNRIQRCILIQVEYESKQQPKELNKIEL